MYLSQIVGDRGDVSFFGVEGYGSMEGKPLTLINATYFYYYLTLCPTDFQTLIPQEPKVGLTSNLAVNSSLFVVSRSKKKIDQFGP